MVTMREIWPRLKPETRDWLIAHNSESLPPGIISEITSADGLVAGAMVLGDASSAGDYLTKADADWIRQNCND